MSVVDRGEGPAGRRIHLSEGPGPAAHRTTPTSLPASAARTTGIPTSFEQVLTARGDSVTRRNDERNTITGLDSLFRRLEARISLLEDHNQILRLLYSYGPGVDSGLAAAVSAIWTEDGVYDIDDPGSLDGRVAIEAMVRGDQHQGFIHQGCGHVMSPAHITIDADSAVAVCHSQLILQRPDGGGYQVSRVTANRWELIRTAEGWKVTTRTSRLLDGSEKPRGILASAFSSD